MLLKFFQVIKVSFKNHLLIQNFSPVRNKVIGLGHNGSLKRVEGKNGRGGHHWRQTIPESSSTLHVERVWPPAMTIKAVYQGW